MLALLLCHQPSTGVNRRDSGLGVNNLVVFTIFLLVYRCGIVFLQKSIAMARADAHLPMLALVRVIHKEGHSVEWHSNTAMAHSSEVCQIGTFALIWKLEVLPSPTVFVWRIFGAGSRLPDYQVYDNQLSACVLYVREQKCICGGPGPRVLRSSTVRSKN